ncbi:hypothetical protein M3Y99_01144900 [Aphelenchoides fujianensis]|nr:hypothetical protein M3Y99_01144900 [Aphelenchoides fujianensis]
MYDRPSMDEDTYIHEFDAVEHKPKQKDSDRCLLDIHVNSATVGILLLKSAITIATCPSGLLIIYLLAILFALFGFQCSRPGLFFPFVVADIVFNVIFGLFCFGLLLFGPKLVEKTELFHQGYEAIPVWFCAFMVVLFGFNLYALHIVLRCRRYLKHKSQRHGARMDTVNASTADSMPDIP